MSGLKPFDRKRKCPKCGGADIHTRHEEKDDIRLFWDCKRGVTAEHMCRHCRYCGFAWDEAPLDRRDPNA